MSGYSREASVPDENIGGQYARKGFGKSVRSDTDISQQLLCCHHSLLQRGRKTHCLGLGMYQAHYGAHIMYKGCAPRDCRYSKRANIDPS